MVYQVCRSLNPCQQSQLSDSLLRMHYFWQMVYYFMTNGQYDVVTNSHCNKIKFLFLFFRPERTNVQVRLEWRLMAPHDQYLTKNLQPKIIPSRWPIAVSNYQVKNFLAKFQCGNLYYVLILTFLLYLDNKLCCTNAWMCTTNIRDVIFIF